MELEAIESAHTLRHALLFVAPIGSVDRRAALQRVAEEMDQIATLIANADDPPDADALDEATERLGNLRAALVGPIETEAARTDR